MTRLTSGSEALQPTLGFARSWSAKPFCSWDSDLDLISSSCLFDNNKSLWLLCVVWRDRRCLVRDHLLPFKHPYFFFFLTMKRTLLTVLGAQAGSGHWMFPCHRSYKQITNYAAKASSRLCFSVSRPGCSFSHHRRFRKRMKKPSAGSASRLETRPLTVCDCTGYCGGFHLSSLQKRFLVFQNQASKALVDGEGHCGNQRWFQVAFWDNMEKLRPFVSVSPYLKAVFID